MIWTLWDDEEETREQREENRGGTYKKPRKCNDYSYKWKSIAPRLKIHVQTCKPAHTQGVGKLSTFP